MNARFIYGLCKICIRKKIFVASLDENDFFTLESKTSAVFIYIYYNYNDKMIYLL